MIHPLDNALGGWRLLLALGSLATEAHHVIVYRLLGLSGGWVVPTDEPHRMLVEKPIALMEANRAAAQALLSGQDANQVTHAWLTPVTGAVQSNRTRLAQNGPAVFGAMYKPFR
ncbi:antifreeze protein [Primorskyibacter aestuariivivens]|uniref:antifreeze protein n=1 Tax=Primorskyibacter aestuariivivens TaxID=1888912 RepID=UPI002300D0F7|nr:antifreeze protein [Primorskyibacter aestuariivivens]MDA7430944.1 antifreeze protein [Primorskyibacter aestuariivivens]